MGWGYNAFGQLGLGYEAEPVILDMSVQPFLQPDGEHLPGDRVTGIACGAMHSAAVTGALQLPW